MDFWQYTYLSSGVCEPLCPFWHTWLYNEILQLGQRTENLLYQLAPSRVSTTVVLTLSDSQILYSHWYWDEILCWFPLNRKMCSRLGCLIKIMTKKCHPYLQLYIRYRMSVLFVDLVSDTYLPFYLIFQGSANSLLRLWYFVINVFPFHHYYVVHFYCICFCTWQPQR